MSYLGEEAARTIASLIHYYWTMQQISVLYCSNICRGCNTKHRENRKMLPFEILFSCQYGKVVFTKNIARSRKAALRNLIGFGGVKLFLLNKYYCHYCHYYYHQNFIFLKLCHNLIFFSFVTI